MDSIFMALLLLGYFAVMGMRWQEVQASPEDEAGQLKDFWED